LGDIGSVSEKPRQTIRGRTVDMATWYDFKREVANKFGTERGHIDFEIDIALREYVEKRTDNKFKVIQ